LLAWSLDDSILLSAADNQIRMYNVRTGLPVRTLDAHTDTVTALSWLPDNTGFISGAMDRKIIIWDSDGNQRDSWGVTAIRVADVAVAPDQSRVVAIGMFFAVAPPSPVEVGAPPAVAPTGTPTAPSTNTHKENRLIIYNFATKAIEESITLEGDLTSVKISADSQYAIVNHAPNEVLLWNLNTARVERRYTGQKQERHVIRSCFGGVDGNFIASGSEDSNVHIWHRDTTVLLETLPGHGAGSVNAVAWNPRNPRMFASCSDDHTVRIWEAIPDANSDAVVREKGKGRTTDREGTLML
jgi:WD40 repeat protein